MSEWTVDTAREDLLSRIKVSQKDQRRALKLQASEYGRRLGELNNAHDRAEDVARRTVSTDKFDEYKTTQDTALKLALERQDDRLGTLENWKAKAVGACVILALFAAALGAAVAKALGI